MFRALMLVCMVWLTSWINTSWAAAENVHKIGAYEIYYDVMPSGDLDPKVAQGYGLVRAKGVGIVRVTVLERLESGGSKAVTARVSGEVSNLAGQLNSLGFKSYQVGQQAGSFNLAYFRFGHDDPLRFRLRVTYASDKPAAEISFIKRLYMD